MRSLEVSLNFSSTETPFSFYFTIRKTLAKIPKQKEFQAQTDKAYLNAGNDVQRFNDVSDNLIKAAQEEIYQLKKSLDASKDKIKLLEKKVKLQMLK